MVFPGHADLPEVPRQTPDDEWLEVAGALRLPVITRDRRIRYPILSSVRMWIEHGVRGFVLTGRASQSTADSFELVNTHWTQIESVIASVPVGPWMYAITKTGLRPITLG